MDLDFLITWKDSPEITTFWLAMLPITELRGAIPFAIHVLELSPLKAFFWGVLGNIVSVLPILALLNPFSKFLMKKSKFFNQYLTKLFHKTRTKHSERFDKVGALLLVSFVSIPLPGSGGWTGSLIAFVFGIRFRTFSEKHNIFTCFSSGTQMFN